ncbi:MAG: hypothetical protein HZA79_10570 [Sphingobacteriales bacterium]|nr:hypothetical protein [Sphingobacteriales bacterium]
MNKKSLHSLLFFFFLSGIPVLHGQMITGVWKGKINRQKVEIKLIQKGDSLTGTSYYYESAGHYRRYSIKGYFDPVSNEAVWWDDQLLDEKSGKISVSTPGKMPLLSRADFNCPGDGSMMLDGKAARKENESGPKGEVHLDKEEQADFEDEWDYIIDTYTTGGNDPELIDSIEGLGRQPLAEPVAITEEPQKPVPVIPIPKPAPEKPEPLIPGPGEVKTTAAKPASIEEKFNSRQKLFIKEIPVAGDSVELRFFDNAEIDGDSISLFLNDKLLFQHIRLTAVAYSIKLPVSELQDSNELVMVAENMGSIPPNTSYMVAIVNGQRQDAYLASTEGSSAMIRLVRK